MAGARVKGRGRISRGRGAACGPFAPGGGWGEMLHVAHGHRQDSKLAMQTALMKIRRFPGEGKTSCREDKGCHLVGPGEAAASP